MALEYYKIKNLSNDTKLFSYNSGSSSPGTQYNINLQGLNSEVIVQSFYPPINIPIGISEAAFTSDSFYPSQPGYAWLWNDGNKVKYIKINHNSTNNFNISPYISDTRIISFAMVGAKDGSGNFIYNPTSSQHVEDYYLTNSIKKPGNYSFLIIEQSPSSNAVSDLTAGQRNFNFESSGSYIWYATSSGNIDNPNPTTGYSSSLAQGYFPQNIEDFGTTQFIRGWAGANYYVGGNLIPTNGNLIDHLGNFNSGSTERDMDGILSNPNNFFPYTSSVLSWFINSPTSSIHIPSNSFGTYTGQPNSFKLGPSYRNTSSESPYGDAVYGDDRFEYGGSGADDFLSYYYREDTNEILVYDPSNISHEDKKPSPLYYPNARYNSILVGINQPQTYITDEGHEIEVGNGNQLIVFRGQQSVGTGDTNAWNYNRYLHKPYKIYLLSETGSNGNPARIVDAYVSFSSSLASERPYDGAYTFESYGQDDLSLTASINLTASNALPLPPSNYGDAEYGEDVYGGSGTIPANQTWKTASLDLYMVDPNQSLGSILTSSILYIDDINTDNSIRLKTVLSSSYIAPGVALRLAVSVDTGSLNPQVNSSLIVTDYSMSIAGPVPEISDIVPTYLDNILQVPEDCNPFVGSALTSPLNNIVMDVDYSSGSTPINLPQILEQKAQKSEIPESHYSTYGIAGPRYEGSKTTGNIINKFTEGDSGTYGKSPVVEINKAYAGYFNRIFDPYPLINNKTNFEVKYIIDENGNASQPRVGEYSFYNLEGSLSEKDNVKISVVDKESEILYPLNSFKKIFKTGQSVSPILYSQVAAAAYTSSIFVTGKVPLSDDPIEFKDLSFRAFENVPSGRVKSFSYQQLSPETLITGSGENVICSYTSSEMVPDNGGVAGDTFIPRSDVSGSQGAGQGKPTSDEYTYRVNYTFETSRINRVKTANGKKGVPGRSTKSSPDVGDFYMKIVKNEQNAKLQLESLYADVIHRNPNTTTGLETKSFNVLNTAIYNGGINRQDIKMESDNVFRIHFNNDRFISAVTTTGTDGVDIRSGGSMIKVRWRVKLKMRTSGGGGFFSKSTPIKQGDKIQTFVKGNMRGSTGGDDDIKQSWFFYSTSTGEYPGSADVNISLEGTKSLPSPALDAQYWAFTGSTGDIIEMIAPNGNIAYGRVGFKQQYMEYGNSGSYPPPIEGENPYRGSFNVPSGSEGSNGWKSSFLNNPDFIGGKEPTFLKFPPVRNDWEVFPGDEIRFNNSEDLVYKIISVTPPISSTPIHPDEEIGRLKLQLDREVSVEANLDFFLIRRYIKDEGNIIIDFPKPYGIPIAPNTATGLMFPEFPVKELNTNPDEVLKNLLEQKLIE